MKRNIFTGLFVALIGAALLSALPAHATKPVPPATPAAGNATANAVGVGLALSGSLSHAEGGDGGIGVGMGGSGGTGIGGNGTGKASVGDINVGTGKTGGTYVMPPPSATLVPQAMYDCTKTDSTAVSVLFSAFSGSTSKQSAEVFCAGIKLAERYDAACQFLSADMIRNRLAVLLFPGSGELPAQPALANLTTEQCTASRGRR